MALLQPGRPVVVYENPAPLLRSRNGYFPGVAQMPDGSLLCAFVIAEAFESVDMATHVARSRDGGVTWALQGPVRPGGATPPVSDSMKPTVLRDGRVLLFGYQFDRSDPDKALANPETGGLLEDAMALLQSVDGGETFVELPAPSCCWGGHVEASAPLYELQDGALATPIAPFADWQGMHHGPAGGRLLISRDGGESFADDAVCMRFADPAVSCFEQRMAQTQSGMLVVIGWNEHQKTGELLCNHYTVSTDGGRSFSEPRSTGVKGQASSLCALGGERLLAVHALRRDTDRPGIYGYEVDVSGGGWRAVGEPKLLWEPPTPVARDRGAAEIFAYLKFGQPSATVLADGRILLTHWSIENGQGRVYATPVGQK